MRHTLRILLATLTLLSLLLFIATAIFWIRGRRGGDSITLTDFPSQWSLSTNSGRLEFTNDRSWLEPAEVKGGTTSFTYERSLLGFGIKQTQQMHSWPVRASSIITYGTVTKTRYAPLWFCFLLFAVLPAIEIPRLIRRIRRHKRGLCPHCGYDLRASPEKCPECGKTVHTKQKEKLPLLHPR